MKRRDFLKYGASGLAGVTLGGLTRTPLLKMGNALACSPDAWKFGVMGDTQWTPTDSSGNYLDPSGLNPNSVAVSIIDQVDAQFVNHCVKFVLQVGDLTDNGTDAGIQTRALAAQTNLYPHHIGFFPMRGNHETYSPVYNNFSIPAIQTNFPQTRGSGTTWGAFNFSSPKPTDPITGKPTVELQGISYSFDYGWGGNSVRFLIVDPWATTDTNPTAAQPPPPNNDGYPYGYTINAQQPWISNQLNRLTRCTEHAFVFSHQPLMAENHQDTMFSGYTNANPTWQNAFYSSLRNNGVGYFIAGHDHMHQRSIIASPDSTSSVEEFICASCSSKFYTPKSLTDPNWFGSKTPGPTNRETSISEELYTVGFYIFTVDGPIVTIDFYSDEHGNWGSGTSYPGGGTGTLITPTFNFTKKETWGYSLSPWGVSRFILTQGSGYALKFGRTSAQIQKQGGTAADNESRLLTKDVQAWWADGSCVTNAYLASDVLTLLGAASSAITPSSANDPVAIIMTYDSSWNSSNEAFTLSTMNDSGQWVNAVDLNFGGTDNFISGPWTAGYPLGSYGFDPKTLTAWAVVNHDSDFAVIKTKG
jgi:hypothetical protein